MTTEEQYLSYAKDAMDSKDYATARVFFERVIEFQNAEAAYWLSRLYFGTYEGVPKNKERAKLLFEFARNKGEPKAIAFYATCLLYGSSILDIPKDCDAGIEVALQFAQNRKYARLDRAMAYYSLFLFFKDKSNPKANKRLALKYIRASLRIIPNDGNKKAIKKDKIKFILKEYWYVILIVVVLFAIVSALAAT